MGLAYNDVERRLQNEQRPGESHSRTGDDCFAAELMALAVINPFDEANSDVLTASSADIDEVLPLEEGLECLDSAVFRWVIPNFTRLSRNTVSKSEKFTCGNCTWSILYLLQGGDDNHVSLFINLEEESGGDLESNWHVCVDFALSISNPEDASVRKVKDAQHRFTSCGEDWGFKRLISLEELKVPVNGHKRPLVERNATVFTAYVRIIKDDTGFLWHDLSNYDSKKETGFLGLKQQRELPDYLRPILQSYFFTNHFRRVVYGVPTLKDSEGSVMKAVQSLFYQMQTSEASPDTSELEKLLIGNAGDSFPKNDAREFSRVLQDCIESRMFDEGEVKALFSGTTRSTVKCANVNYESVQVEEFRDILLDVRGCKTLIESFERFVLIEERVGDRKFCAGDFGPQDPQKSAKLQSLPAVLHLHLKRHEYDAETEEFKKVTDRHEFPVELDLESFLCDEADRTIPQHYSLYGVLASEGDSDPHYCAFLRTEFGGNWFNFDKEVVVPVTKREAVEYNFGEASEHRIGDYRSACMLVYIRNHNLPEIMRPVHLDEIPRHIVWVDKAARLKQLANDIRIYVVTDSDIRRNKGFDLCNFDQNIYPNCPLTGVGVITVKQHCNVGQLMRKVSRRLGVPKDDFKLWIMGRRINKSVRPSDRLDEMDVTIGSLREKNEKYSNWLRVYVELPDLTHPIDLDKRLLNPKENETSAILFVKFFDPKIGEMEYLGKVTVQSTALKVEALLPWIRERKDFHETTELKLFEEIKASRIDLVKPTDTFQEAELGNGDIICAQIDYGESKHSTTIPSYFARLLRGPKITFKYRKEGVSPIGDKGRDVVLSLSKKLSFQLIAKRLAGELGIDPAAVRFFTPVAKQPIEHISITLGDFLAEDPHCNHMFTVVYEVNTHHTARP
ncbi:hypothetical protein BJ742DRAFT_788824 [Cladochytrium replicatum]|nr:hypothetical protein BJ742DRAFT_788824 [Cladochytrium replicatum]